MKGMLNKVNKTEIPQSVLMLFPNHQSPRQRKGGAVGAGQER